MHDSMAWAAPRLGSNADRRPAPSAHMGTVDDTLADTAGHPIVHDTDIPWNTDGSLLAPTPPSMAYGRPWTPLVLLYPSGRSRD